jgi:hypothetical protein
MLLVCGIKKGEKIIESEDNEGVRQARNEVMLINAMM